MAGAPLTKSEQTWGRRNDAVRRGPGNAVRDWYTSRSAKRSICALVVAIGAIVRLLLWWNSIGSNDALIWYSHAEAIRDYGIVGTYEQVQAFNHPPLIGLYMYAALAVADGDLLTFAHLLKLPALAGEALTIVMLWRFAGCRAAAVYALLPAPILVSAFHGNTDCLLAALLLGSALAFDRDRYLLAGLLFGAAMNVKVVPLVLLPVVLLAPLSVRVFVRLVAGMAVGAIPFVLPALFAARAMIRNMVEYVPNPDNWGVLSVLNPAVDQPRLAVLASPARDWYIENGRYFVLLAIVAVAVLARARRPIPISARLAAAIALFLLLAPGFGVQYVVYAIPLLCLIEMKAAIQWGLAAGLFIGCVYWTFVTSWSPIQSIFSGPYPAPAPVLGAVAWTVLLAFLARVLPWRSWLAIPSRARDQRRTISTVNPAISSRR